VAWAKAIRWLRTVAALAAALACAWPAMAQNGQVGVRVGVGAFTTRVVIDSPSRLSVTAEPASDSVAVFRIAGLSPDAALQGDGRGLVRDWRLEGGERTGRFSLDLDGQGEVADSFAIPPTAEHPGYRYVIDIASPDRARSGRVVAATADSEEATAFVASTRTRHVSRDLDRSSARKVIVIDAGHGGHDPGAQNGDTDEKNITLAAALHLRHRLRRDGRYKVVMTRSDDTFVPLEERVRIARRAGADLFIALHADTAGGNDAPHGASVYTLSGHGETRVNEVLDGHEWFNRAAPHSDPAVKGILLDLTQRSTLNRSSVFAQTLVDRLSEKIDVLPRTHRDASYFVLLAPDVPAVLLEMGFISSPQDKARLTDPARRDAMMDTVAAAIDDYFRGGLTLAAN